MSVEAWWDTMLCKTYMSLHCNCCVPRCGMFFSSSPHSTGELLCCSRWFFIHAKCQKVVNGKWTLPLCSTHHYRSHWILDCHIRSSLGTIQCPLSLSIKIFLCPGIHNYSHTPIEVPSGAYQGSISCLWPLWHAAGAKDVTTSLPITDSA